MCEIKYLLTWLTYFFSKLAKMLVFIFGLLIVVLLYSFMTKKYSYWKERGVKQGNPVWFLGDNWENFIRRKSIAESIQGFYSQFPGNRYSGMYNMLKPALIVKDPDLLKQITVKAFDHFADHRSFVPEDTDPYWSKNLFALKGKKWREMRSILSPTFTGSKMKTMFTLIDDCAQNFAKHFLEKDQDVIEVEMKDCYTRFTNDVIATSAFGVKVDSLKDPNNEFYLMGKDVTNFGNFFMLLKFIAYSLVPSVRNIITVNIFPANVTQFFLKIISETIKIREAKGIVRPDMIHLLMEARKGVDIHEDNDVMDTGFSTAQESLNVKTRSPTNLTNDDITAQALIFFVAGFETASGLMCFLSHELAVNSDIQDRLRKEVQDTFEECKGKLTYEGLLKMKYMDMVVSEGLRKWPIAVSLDRLCTKSFTIDPVNADEKTLYVEKDISIIVPTFSIHRDPKYFPDPDRFDPERFSDENKGKIKPYTYLPFGLGPRNCIGSRFALLETKAVFFNILLHFRIVPTAKTAIPLKISKKSPTLFAENGFWLGLERLKM